MARGIGQALIVVTLSIANGLSGAGETFSLRSQSTSTAESGAKQRPQCQPAAPLGCRAHTFTKLKNAVRAVVAKANGGDTMAAMAVYVIAYWRMTGHEDGRVAAVHQYKASRSATAPAPIAETFIDLPSTADHKERVIDLLQSGLHRQRRDGAHRGRAGPDH